MIDPLWNESAKLASSYKDVMLDIYAPECFVIEQIDDSSGFEYMAKALKRHALQNINEKG